MELDYPRDMSMWGGIGNDIDTAFQFKNHRTYFFKGSGFWEFNDNSMEVAHERPRSSAHKWMKCARGQADQESFDGSTSSRRGERMSAASASPVLYSSTAKRIGLILALVLAFTRL